MITIKTDENNVVVAWTKGDGYVEGYTEVASLPEDIEAYKYMYVDGEYTVNPDYVEPTDEPTSDEPTSEEILNVLLGVAE